MKNAGLTVRNLSVSHGDQCVLQPLSFDCQSGEFIVFAGPSGSGKSTLLRALAGLLDNAQGQIELDGRRLESLSPGQREVAMVFQDHALMPHLNLLDNLAFGLRARGSNKKAARQRALEVAQRLGLDHAARRKPAQLSGGEQQRVALGRAMLRDAKLVLMDEPLSSLDAPLRARLRTEIRQLHQQQGWTTLYVTHDQAEALAMADRIGVIENGVLLQLDAPRKLYQQPANLAVARFVGEPAINLLPFKRNAQGGLQLADDGDLLVGIRPERVTPLACSEQQTDPLQVSTQGIALKANVQYLDYVGDQQIVHLQAAQHRVRSKQASSTTYQVDQAVSLRIGWQDCLLFDAKSGQALPMDSGWPE